MHVRWEENLMTVEFSLCNFLFQEKAAEIIFSFTKAAFFFQGYKEREKNYKMIHAKNEQKVCE